jgi:hypothetical protein
LEQVHVRGIFCRSPRLEGFSAGALVAGLAIALAVPALAMRAEAAPATATYTTLSAETRIQNGHSTASAAVAVTGEDGLPATGAVAIEEHGKQLASAALDAEGKATLSVTLTAGHHALRAVYFGDEAHAESASDRAEVDAVPAVTGTPNFSLSLAPVSPTAFPLTLTPGQSGTVAVTVTPVNNAALTGPMFVTLSCSGLPDFSSCTFTPENVEISADTTTVGSSMVITTQAQSGSLTKPAIGPQANPVAWAFLLPGALALAGFGWRRRSTLGRLSLLALVALVSVLGTTACAPRYNYYHHGPEPNLPTPAGTYTITVTGQSSNGITVITQNTTLALTVK